ncbi:OmpA family protein [Psychrosphaera ytuae]|uniref:OmpA family protein n=1 Tax=Psychrosphaera ytuae TaxID=2820710 RepID=A0A975HHM3_9GAMM|nr:OmpA family protein [Psychrosphaera ytuae]QTH63285.1 OmpA family protein [Psychrosphaera ytuae]
MEKPSSPVESQDSDQQELAQLRSIILGRDNVHIKSVLREDARHLVSEVITEAIFDRQKNDASLNNVLQPLVEESVQKSVTHHSDKMVSSLYPLMGNLVRKYVTAFLADFIERTNQLIENSLTIQSVKWRFEAKRAGMDYAQYVASQTFVYRVEHVFLIHGETGLLLNSVAHNNNLKSDADIISSMLTAINDFVGDSFLDSGDGQREQLQSVSTDNFNLLIKPGPKAIIVAAVIGHPPQQLSDQLQLTLEQIHSLYTDPLSDFEGDNEPFANTESALRECLLSQQKLEKQQNKKIPWYGLLISAAIVLLLVFLSYRQWLASELNERIQKISEQPGIILTNVDTPNNSEATITLLRDPSAISVSQWLEDQNIPLEQLTVIEKPYQSLESEIKLKKAQSVLAQYPELTLEQEQEQEQDALIINGQVSQAERVEISSLLTAIGFDIYADVKFAVPDEQSVIATSSDPKVLAMKYQDLVSQISAAQFNFEVNSSQLTAGMRLQLQLIADKITAMDQLASSLKYEFGLLIIGASDGSGSSQQNEQLSERRAKRVADYLQTLGINPNKLYIKGLGQINLDKVSEDSRTVLLNVVTTQK